MFKFKIGQHVWFLLGPMAQGGDLEYREGDITKQDAVANFHGSPDAVYEIQASDGVYERDEREIYASFDEVCAVVDANLEYQVCMAGQRIEEIAKELQEALANQEAAEKRLRDWNSRCRKASAPGRKPRKHK